MCIPIGGRRHTISIFIQRQRMPEARLKVVYTIKWHFPPTTPTHAPTVLVSIASILRYYCTNTQNSAICVESCECISKYEKYAINYEIMVNLCLSLWFRLKSALFYSNLLFFNVFVINKWKNRDFLTFFENVNKLIRIRKVHTF